MEPECVRQLFFCLNGRYACPHFRKLLIGSLIREVKLLSVVI